MRCLTCGYWEATIGDQCESCAMSVHRADHNGTDTSRDANVYALPNRPRDRDRVLHALVAAGEHGLTDFELSAVLTEQGPAIGQTSAGKRRGDLVKDGLVARRLVWSSTSSCPDDYMLVPDRRPSPTGAPAAVWCLAHFSEPVVRHTVTFDWEQESLWP